MIDACTIQEVKKEEKEILIDIKYLLEAKTELERLVKVGEDAKKQLSSVNERLKSSMQKYLN